MAKRNKQSEVFREKSLERVSSPENLDQYIKSTTPSLWLLLCSVILLLVGVLVWSVFGTLDSSSVVGCKVEGGVLTSYIPESDYEKLKEDSYIEVEGQKYAIATVSNATLTDGDSDGFLVQAGGIEEGTWYYVLTAKTDLPDGKYKGSCIFEQISPITFIVN